MPTNIWLQRSAAYDRSADPEILVELALDSDLDTRKAVSMNPSTPLSALTFLAFDLDWLVRSFVAEHPNASPDMLCLLSRDRRIEVSYYTYRHPSTPFGIWVRWFGRVLS